MMPARLLPMLLYRGPRLAYVGLRGAGRGLGYTLPVNRLDYTVPALVLDFTLPPNWLDYTLPDTDGT